MATTSDLHVLCTDIEIADFPKILADGELSGPLLAALLAPFAPADNGNH